MYTVLIRVPKTTNGDKESDRVVIGTAWFVCFEYSSISIVEVAAST